MGLTRLTIVSSVCRPVSAMGDQILQLNLGDDDGKTEDREIPEQEWLLLRAQILSMPSESKDAVVKLLQLPKRQQMLLLSAVKLDESGRIRASNDGRNAGSSSAGYPPRADVGAGSVELEVLLPRELDVTDGHAMEVVAELGRIAEAGGQDPIRIHLPFQVESTLEFQFRSGNRWFYLLKCTLCTRMAVTKSGNGNGPVDWATRVAGWTRPESGRAKWKRCRCPRHQ